MKLCDIKFINVIGVIWILSFTLEGEIQFSVHYFMTVVCIHTADCISLLYTDGPISSPLSLVKYTIVTWWLLSA